MHFNNCPWHPPYSLCHSWSLKLHLKGAFWMFYLCHIKKKRVRIIIICFTFCWEQIVSALENEKLFGNEQVRFGQMRINSLDSSVQGATIVTPLKVVMSDQLSIILLSSVLLLGHGCGRYFTGVTHLFQNIKQRLIPCLHPCRSRPIPTNQPRHCWSWWSKNGFVFSMMTFVIWPGFVTMQGCVCCTAQVASSKDGGSQWEGSTHHWGGNTSLASYSALRGLAWSAAERADCTMLFSQGLRKRKFQFSLVHVDLWVWTCFCYCFYLVTGQTLDRASNKMP